MLERSEQATVEIHLIGPIRAQAANGVPLLPRSKKARAILAALCLSADGRYARSRLASLLWDDVSDEASRSSLRQALHELSARLEAAPGLVVIDREGIIFDRTRCWIDIGAPAETPADPKARLAELAHLDPARLLEDLNGLSETFDEWLRTERTRLATRLADEVGRLFESALIGATSPAERRQLAALVLRFDETHEGASRTLIQALNDLGETAAALKEFDRLRDALREALEVEPSAETRALYGTIRAAAEVSRKQSGESENRPRSGKPSIVVLPFQSLSGDAEGEALADGVVEEITTALARSNFLSVIARNLAFAYKGRAIDIRQVGRDLRAQYCLEGSVRRSDNRIRIAAQLVEAKAGKHLWADQFDGGVDEAFDLEDSTSERVAGTVMAQIHEAEFERVRQLPTGDLSAFDCYVRASERIRLGSAANLREALELSKRAVELDPSYASAYGLALFSYISLWGTRTIDDDAATHLAAMAALAEKCVLFGSGEALPMAAAASYHSSILQDPHKALPLAEQAVALNPNTQPPRFTLANICNHLGDYETAIRHLDKAIRLNPSDVQIHVVYGYMAASCFFLRRFDEARAWASKAVARNPHNLIGWRILAAAHVRLGQTAEAERVMARILQVEPGITLSFLERTLPYRQPKDRGFYLESLRLAGLPE